MKPTEKAAVTVVIVDDSELVRMGLQALLASEKGLRVVGEAGSVAAALEIVARQKPQVVMLDIRLPDGTGFDACRRILERLPDTRVLFLTSVVDDRLVDEAIHAGGHGYLLKDTAGQDLVQALLDVARGKSVLDPTATAHLVRLVKSGATSDPLASLSAQERRVLARIAEGKTNKEVGAELNLTEKTVKNYLANIFDKLDVTRRSQAVALFVGSGNK